MRRNDFWLLVARARAEAADSGHGWPAAGAVGESVQRRLTKLPLAQIVEFDVCLIRAAGRASRWELCAAAYLIWGYVSDDMFDDFRFELVGLGPEVFERVVAHADALADLPLIRAVAAGQADRSVLSGGAMQSAACTAYVRRGGDEEDFWDAVRDRMAEDRPGRSRPAGEVSDGLDAARIPRQLPRLHALFSDQARRLEPAS